MAKKTSSRPRKSATSKNSFTTKSGKTIKVHRSFGERFKASRDARERRRANRLATLPKDRLMRVVYHLQPRRVIRYWFSRDGLIMALKLTGIAFVAGFVVLVGLFAYFRRDLPILNDISGKNLGGSITYYDRTGTVVLWQDYDAVKRIQVTGDQISPYMKEATVAIEDRNFFKEGAFDIRGIVRAGLHDTLGIGGSAGLQGGSTITQQLVKLNEGWTNNRTLSRKVKELILAVELEREYSKNDILTGYLNIAPYGGVDYGVETAARDYFGVSAKDLTLPQAAMLAAIPQYPSYYSPYSDPKYNPAATAGGFGATDMLNRQHYILDQMASQGYITKQQASAAKKVDILAQVHPLQSLYNGIKAPYFVLTAKQQLINKFGEGTVNFGGWKVTTTLDMNLQNTAEQLVAKNFRNIQRVTRGAADEEALVLEDVHTGQIMALVGGTNFDDPNHGKINYASQVLIPPGSSFKPYDYATLINNNTDVGAGSVLYDVQQPLPGYPCTIKGLPPPKGHSNCLQDYDFLNPGPLTIRYAFGGSRNIPAVKAMLEAVPGDTSTGKVNSINKVISTATAMMDNPYNPAPYQCFLPDTNTSNPQPSDVTQCYQASAIGDGAFLHLDDHVNGLATLARLGNAIPHTYILKVQDASGKVLYQFSQPAGTQVIRPDAAYIVDNMASDPNASYLPGSCSATNCSPLSYGGYKFHRYNGWDFAIKTGTTSLGFDGLMTSWSTKYAVVSWVGNHTRNVVLGGPGMEYLTEPLTRGMMEAAHAGLKPVNWTQPSDIKVLPAFVVRKHIDHGDVEPSPSTDLFPSWYVAPAAQANTSQVIDKVSGKTATSCTPDAAKQTVEGGNDKNFSIDIFYPPGGSTGSGSASGSDDVHNCSDLLPSFASFFINGQSMLPNPPPTISCVSTCTITATVTQGTHPLSDPQYPQYPGTVNLLANGQVVQSQPAPSSPTTVSFDYSTPGTVSLSVQVIDSVLYQTTSPAANVTFTAAPTPTPTPAAGNNSQSH